MAKGLESVEHLERSGKFNRLRTTSELVLNKNDQIEQPEQTRYEPYPRSNTAADMRDEAIVYPQPVRSNVPTVRSGSRQRMPPQMQRQHSYNSYTKSEISDTSDRAYTFVPSLLSKLRNGIKPTEVTCSSRASSRMSQDTGTGTFAGNSTYAWSKGGGQFTAAPYAPSVAFSAKSDYDQEAIERYASVRSKAELPASIPVKDSKSDFVCAGETYSYDGQYTVRNSQCVGKFVLIQFAVPLLQYNLALNRISHFFFLMILASDLIY